MMTSQELRTSPLLRSIRMDVFSMDEDRIIYNSEMQKQLKYDLPKRSRYYQSLLDSSLLEPGSVHFNLLNDSFIIIITPYDVFGLGKYRYTFRARCDENTSCILPDGATRIFLNTKGTNREEAGEELAQFLEYAEKTDDISALNSNNEKILRIHEHIRMLKSSEEMGVKYMQAWEEKLQVLEEGLEKGIQLTKKVLKLSAEGRSESEISELCDISPEQVRRILDA